MLASGIARWDGTSWSALGSGAGGVHALTVHDDGGGSALYAGGEFTITYRTGKTITAGCVPFLSHSGTARWRPDAAPLGEVDGAFNIFSTDHLEANLNFHGGKLCVKAPIRRVVGLIKTTDGIPCTSCAGNCRTFKRNFNALIQSGTDPALTPGQSVKVQAQQRDPLDPFVDNLSNGIAFVIGP